MIPCTKTKIYNWFDIQAAICEKMGINENQFRSYHQVVGGNYKDLWHVALATIIPPNMANDTVVTMWPIGDQMEDDGYWLEGRPWARPMFEAYDEVMKKLDPKFNGINVRFSW